MANYIPPSSKNIPFRFTDAGYVKPNFGPLPFLFKSEFIRDLSAAVQAVTSNSPYQNEAFTYTKRCPTSVIGYSNGQVQIFKGRCEYGGIRDLQGIISPKTIESIYVDLPSFVRGMTTRDLYATVRPYTIRDLPAKIRLYFIQDFPAILEGTTFPRDLNAYLKSHSRNNKLLSANILSWHDKLLAAEIIAKQAKSLIATLLPIPPADLGAYIKTWPQQDLPASARSWNAKDLGGYIGRVYSHDLGAKATVVLDRQKNLHATLKGIGKTYGALNSILVSMWTEDLSAYIRAKYFKNLQSIIKVEQPRNIKASLHGWAQSFLSASIFLEPYKWDLKASIKSSGSLSDLLANLKAAHGVNITKNLPAIMQSWQPADLSAIIFAAGINILPAYINPLLGSKDLNAAIAPKMIRLTSLVKVSTMSHRNLSATINYLCFKTGYSNLQSTLRIVYKSDIFAYVRPTISFNTKNLSASAGYNDHYNVVDKLKISLNISSSSYYVEDRLRIVLNCLKSAKLLGAYIKCIPTSIMLKASIVGKEIKVPYYEETLKNRETVVRKNYSGVFKSYEVVEFAFKDVVKDYYYSSAGESIWKSDRLEHWILAVKSYIPANTTLGIKRKLHKAVDLYDLKKFSSLDEAMRYAIDFVTTYPELNLTANINANGKVINLNSSIKPLYTRNANSNFSASITPAGVSSGNILINNNGNLIKL